MSTNASPRHSTLEAPSGRSSLISADVIRRLRRAAPTLAATVAGAAYLLLAPTGADLPAALLRTRLFGAEGFGIWSNWWYAGHNLPGYSVLFPPLAWLATPQLITALAGAVYLVLSPTGADLPAALLRTRLFGAEGFGIWNNWWYAGHNLPGYSVLYPPLAWLTTPQLIAALAGVITAAAFAALTREAFGEDAWLGATWLGAATVTEALSGRLAFALGLSGAALTALALQRWQARRRPTPALAAAAILAAFLTALASPVAALFAALAGATVLAAGLPRIRVAGVAVIIAALAPIGALAIAFPQGGTQPFALSTLWPLELIAAVLLATLPRDARVLRIATALYALGCLLAYAIPSPVGANAARLGELVAGPLAALLLYRNRRSARALAMLVLAGIPLTYIQVHDAVTDLQHGSQAPSDTAAYFRPLIRFLERRPGAAGHTFRVEVPFTQGHWEADRLAPLFPLARGWERQLDIADNHLFYGGPLTAATYERWLHRLAVRYVAVPDAPPDYSARAEANLIAHGLRYLKPVATLRHWRVYQVTDATPIASGAATLTDLGPESLTLRFGGPGVAYLRVRFSPYWRLEGVRGCVAPAGGFTRVSARSSGTARLVVDFSLGRIGAYSRRCS
ncbi:MAG: hypothetical protein ACRDKL_01970 [Solirubrobacteraceae bacterium]